jgi:GNAT superfamily N-acetyltransferase
MENVEVIRIPGMTSIRSPFRDDTFNCVTDTHLRSEEADSRIAKMMTYFNQFNLPFAWWVGPTDEPEDLSSRLEKCGLTHAEDHIGMFKDLSNWKESTEVPQIEIKRALDLKALSDFASVLTNGNPSFVRYFERLSESPLQETDPVELYVGYVDGKPVTRGMMVLYAGVAGMHYLSTAPDARRKGYAAAIHQHRFKRAKELGYTAAVVLASPEAVSLDRKQGFEEYCRFKEFRNS